MRWVDFDPATAELDPKAVAAALSPRTRLVACTAASNLLGTRPDLAAIAADVHAAGALLYVDGVHHTAHVASDVVALGADFYGCSPYKFLGPHCGAVVADPALLETVHPDKLAPATDAVPERFELGTLPYELMAGTTAAVDLLASLGRVRAVAGPVWSRRSRPSRRTRTPCATVWRRAWRALPVVLTRGLRDVRRRCCSPSPTRSPRRCRVALAERDINAPSGNFYAWEASHHLGLGETGGLRVGLAPYSTEDEIDRLVAALAEILLS